MQVVTSTVTQTADMHKPLKAFVNYLGVFGAIWDLEERVGPMAVIPEALLDRARSR